MRTELVGLYRSCCQCYQWLPVLQVSCLGKWPERKKVARNAVIYSFSPLYPVKQVYPIVLEIVKVMILQNLTRDTSFQHMTPQFFASDVMIVIQLILI